MKEFDLIGDVGFDITGQLVSSMLQEAGGDDVTFYMASLGGSLHDGSAINGVIEKYPGKTKGVIIGNTASAGTIAILGCDEVVINNSAAFLIHNSSDMEGGNAKALRQKAAQLERLDKLMLSIYRKKTGLSDQKLIELMEKEDWLSPEEAKRYGFVNKIESSYKAVAYVSSSKLSEDLKTKLYNKMNIFNRKKEDSVLNTVNLKDGKTILFSGAELAVNAEVGMIGAAAIEDGEYTLEDGRILIVSDGAVTEIKEAGGEPGPEMNEAAIIEAVTATVATAIDGIKAELEASFDKKLNDIKASIKSNHIPAGGTQIPGGQPGKKDSVHAKVRKMQEEIRAQIEESRKA